MERLTHTHTHTHTHTIEAIINSVQLRLLIFLPAILIPVCAPPNPAFHMIYSACKLNKLGDNIQHWHTPFPIWNQSMVPYLVLTVVSWPAYRFLRRQVRWSGIPISLRIFQFVVIHTVKGFGVVNKAKVDVSLEFSCFFYDPTDVDNLISGSSTTFKSSWTSVSSQFTPPLKPGLENFDHYFARVWDECNCAVVWTFFGIAFLWIGMKTDVFQSCGHCWVFHICWHIWQHTAVFLPRKSHGQRSLVGYSPWGCKESDTTEWLHFQTFECSTFTASFFRI